jgi:TPR repeat protein
MKSVLTALLLAFLCGGAQAADARADYRMGLMVRNGTGVAPDPVRAAGLIASAARAQLPEAMFTLSQMLAQGEGVRQDAAAARRWLEEAAALAYAPALQELALREPDPGKAELLMRQAAHALQHR